MIDDLPKKIFIAGSIFSLVMELLVLLLLFLKSLYLLYLMNALSDGNKIKGQIQKKNEI